MEKLWLSLPNVLKWCHDESKNIWWRESKKLGTSAATVSSKDLKELCVDYNTRYAKFLIKGYDHLIQSLKVSKDPLVT